MALNIVIMAAGKGTRMKSAAPKVLHKLAGRSLLAHVLGTAEQLQAQRTVLIVGHGGVNRILLSHFLGILPKLDRTPAPNTNISVVHTDGKTHTVERLFAADHVTGAEPTTT